ncbi:MAG TPA: hypothetical protein VML75_16980 [Kofleriaceae bacterium]|nr:hypothetical protein [Kofleriaceae bacterium]
MNKTPLLTWVVVSLVVAGASSIAHADYESDKNNQNFGVVERALDAYKKDPAIFDGKRITPGAAVGPVKNHVIACNNVIDQFNAYYTRVSPKGKATDRAKKIVARVTEIEPWCKALVAASNAYIGAIESAQQAESQARSELKAKCDRVRVETFKAFPISVRLYEVLDTWRGAMTPSTAEHVTEFRGHLDTLSAVCSRPEFRGVVESCKGQGSLSSSATNQGFDYGDLCAPAVDSKATLTAVAMRMIAYMTKHMGGTDLPTADWFRHKEGWIGSTGVVSYATFFEVSEKEKKEITAKVHALFAAAGVEPPSDLSSIWAQAQKYNDAYKAVVDETAGEWKITDKKCTGYACNLAKKSVTTHMKGAKIKAVYARDWYISKNSLGVPLERYQSMKVVYQMKGEPFCQVRSATAHEPYKGGGKYQKAKGTGWGFVRFQKC